MASEEQREQQTTGPRAAGERLKRLVPDVLRQWEERVRSEVPAARQQEPPVLRDSVPGFLERLADALSRAQAQDLPLETDVAQEHGAQRAGLSGYTLEQVIHEYHLLRRVLLELLEAPAPLAPEARALIHAGLDRAIEAAAGEYVRATRQALREVEEPYRLLVESAEDYAIFILDAEGRIATWNRGAERILGFTEEEALGQPGAIIFTPEDRERGVPETELETARQEGRAEGERWHQRRDGSRFFASGVLTLLGEDGLRGFAKILRDITQRRQLEESLRQQTEALAVANRRKDEFLAVLGHELRNAVAPVLHAVHLVRARPEPEQVERGLQVVERQSRHLARLVDDLLDVARITRGALALSREVLDLETTVANVVQASRAMLEERQLHLSVSVPLDPVRLEGDPVRLEQVLCNLVGNAAKFTEPGGQIWITAERERDRAVIRVRDTGRGIPRDMLPRVFEQFTQVEPRSDQARGGLGLGLTLVKRLVELHGGTVEAQSAGPGQGSEFTVRLPALPEEQVAEAGASPGSEGRPVRGLRLLVADDNEDAAEMLAGLLEAWGHQVRTVFHGRAALNAVLQAPPELRPEAVLLDVALPELDGYEVARQVRRELGDSGPVLIAVTGYGQDEDRRRASEAGFHHHLVKPVTPLQLQRLLAAIPG